MRGAIDALSAVELIRPCRLVTVRKPTPIEDTLLRRGDGEIINLRPVNVGREGGLNRSRRPIRQGLIFCAIGRVR